MQHLFAIRCVLQLCFTHSLATDLAKENPGGTLKSGRWGDPGYMIPSLPGKIQFSLLIYGFHVYRFAYLLKFVTSKSIFVVPSWSFMHVPRAVKNVSCLTHMFPVEVKQGNVLPSCHSSHTYKCLFQVFVPCFSHFCASLVISL